jgi:hypothetical protein
MSSRSTRAGSRSRICSLVPVVCVRNAMCNIIISLLVMISVFVSVCCTVHDGQWAGSANTDKEGAMWYKAGILLHCTHLSVLPDEL